MIEFPAQCATSQQEAELFSGTTLTDWLDVSSTYGLFRSCAQTHKDRIALTHLESGLLDEQPRQLTYAELFAEVNQTANLLSSFGASRGKAVALLMPNLLESYFFAWAAGAVSTSLPLNYMLAPSALVALMRAAKADILVAPGPEVDGGIWDKVQAIRAELGSQLRCVIQVGGATARAPWVVSYDEAKITMPVDRLTHANAPTLNDNAAYFHTGGTTGTPKLVRHTHRNQLTSAYAFAYRYQISPDDVAINGLPLYHVAGAICCGLGQLMRGAHIINLSRDGLRNRTLLGNIWKLVERYRVTLVGAVPTAIGAIADAPVGGANLSSVKKAFSGGSLMSQSVADRFERLTGVHIHEAYGMTETSALISTDLLQDRHITGSAGYAVPFMQTEIRELLADGSIGTSVPVGTSGVIVVKGPAVTPGYLDPRHDADAFCDDGWLITGDVGYKAEDGRIAISGRSKDVIIRSGHNIDPMTIEEAALSHPDISSAVAVGQPDRYAGELPVCFVVPKPGRTLDVGEVMRHLESKVSERPAIPKNLYVLDTLPLTSVGKVYKPALRCDATTRMLEGLLGDVARLKVSVQEDGGRGLLVQLRCKHGSDIESLRAVLEQRLDSFLFRWKLTVDAREAT
ncbi:AMP-binding protein [Caballeronia sp. LjRoot34]|uniref:AMP-binding protein n=1 Tax=Caballeronia sp. LjRoot34 TaxID=3342325 RepID=UPI003ECDE9D8